MSDEDIVARALVTGRQVEDAGHELREWLAARVRRLRAPLAWLAAVAVLHSVVAIDAAAELMRGASGAAAWWHAGVLAVCGSIGAGLAFLAAGELSVWVRAMALARRFDALRDKVDRLHEEATKHE